MNRLSEQCSCGAGILSLGDWFRSLCEPSTPAEEPGHARLQRIHEERAREQAAAKARAEELKLENERKAKEWEKEMVEIEKRRAELTTGEALEKDCLAYFATADLLLARHEDATEETVEVSEATPQTGTEVVASEDLPEAVEVPKSPIPEILLSWLDERCLLDDLQASASASFGQLPDARCLGLAESLLKSLKASARFCEETADTFAPPKEEEEGESLSEQLEKLLAKYEDPDGPQDTSPPSTGAAEAAEHVDGELHVHLQEHIAACNAVSDKLSPLIPVLEGDLATTRLVVALSVVDIGCDLARHVPEGSLPAPFRSLSTADVCWGLCSEKRRLVVDAMLTAEWSELRRNGVGWWISAREAQGLELLNLLVTKLAQASLAKLRSQTQLGGALEIMDSANEARSNVRRQNIDEAVFWSVVLGSSIPKLRALLKTGLLRESQQGGLAVLLQHEKVGEPEFLRKNAFRLLQLHRYHLAAALFLLSDAVEEAALVLANHLQDLQLVLLVTRRHPDVCHGIMKKCLEDIPAGDPWLRLLLTYHGGDTVRPSFSENETSAQQELFDRSLRLCQDASGLAEVVDKLLP